MLALACWPLQLLFERVTMFVVPPALTGVHTFVFTLVALEALPPGAPGPPPAPAPPVGLSCATAMPPAVAARAVAPKAATIAFRVLIRSSPFSDEPLHQRPEHRPGLRAAR